MNKTVTVNIGGIVFHIEEQAYEKLRKYLEAIRGYFKATEGGDEIMQDIEARIAEMFQESIKGGKEVVVDTDVEHAMEVLGKPEQFADSAMEDEPASSTRQERRSYRRLYRDDDDKVLGGVCSGFSHYLGIDPLWLRLIFAIAFFVFGTGILLYIILWIVMPKAKTTAEKLEMKGEQVNISNISKSVKEEISSVASGKGKATETLRNVFDAFGQILAGTVKVILKILAVLIVIAGIIVFGSLFLALLAMLGVAGFTIPAFLTQFFLTPWQQFYGLTGLILAIGIPLFVLIYKAIQLLFKIRKPGKVVNASLLVLWIVGVIFCFLAATLIAREYAVSETNRTEIPVNQPAGGTFYIENLRPKYERDENHYFRNRNGEWNIWNSVIENDTVWVENVNLDVIKAAGDKFELVKIVSARGKTRKDAIDNTRGITNSVLQQDSILKFDERLMIPKISRYRDQKVQLILKVPVGKSIFFGPGSEEVIYDIENISNTWDHDMIGKKWTMTQKGLECIGCGFEIKSDDVDIKIDKHGIVIHGDDDSVISKSSDVQIDVSSEGVHIKSKGE